MLTLYPSTFRPSNRYHQVKNNLWETTNSWTVRFYFTGQIKMFQTIYIKRFVYNNKIVWQPVQYHSKTHGEKQSWIIVWTNRYTYYNRYRLELIQRIVQLVILTFKISSKSAPSFINNKTCIKNDWGARITITSNNPAASLSIVIGLSCENY